ncbi:hypothetical protein Tco_0429073 [Tanacetum coccineum]
MQRSSSITSSYESDELSYTSSPLHDDAYFSETPKTPETHSVRYDDEETEIKLTSEKIITKNQKKKKKLQDSDYIGREAEDNETTKKRSKKEKVGEGGGDDLSVSFLHGVLLLVSVARQKV